ncbi:class I SAM-dependent methyltransferase [Kingella negevensis]|uniref:class I SAM-dependent methyltransferase n=1 Tax=Kingella negevensis TaxID=1522312 RepID=UPI00050A0443|nr:class I SAM-dependent methyltransferase [Kingella negevensis]
MYRNILPFLHDQIRAHIQSGDCVIDATAGNGHDTLFLAQCVGETGRVFAFDIQTAALQQTEQRLQQNGVAQCVSLIHAGHEQMAEFVAEEVSAVMFNFGYLPRGNHEITTQPETSLQAFQAALKLLKVQGIVTAALYHGHEAGKDEMREIVSFAAQLPQEKFRVLRYEFINQRNCPPVGLVAQKLEN